MNVDTMQQISFTKEQRRKLISWMFHACDKYSIHSFHIHKAVIYSIEYFKINIPTTEREMKIVLSIGVGLSLKLYEKEPISFYQLQKIFDYLALIKDMNELERNILLANHFQLLKVTYFESTTISEKNMIAHYLLLFDGLEKYKVTDLDEAIEYLLNPSDANLPNQKCLTILINGFKELNKNINTEIKIGGYKLIERIQENIQTYLSNFITKDQPSIIELSHSCKMNYQKVSKIMQIKKSTEGIVYKAKNESGIFVAFKLYDFIPLEFGIIPFTLSDLTFQNLFEHENIMSSIGISYEFGRFGNIMQLCDSDLHNFIQHYNPILSSNPELYFKLIKPILFDITRAVKYMHDMNIVHSDLKPQNILINQYDKTILKFDIKITDFSISRNLIFNKLISKFNVEQPTIGTLWYRPIEILLGSLIIDDKTDVWSLGCIFAEIVIGKPLFVAHSKNDTIKQIFNLLGNPNPLDQITQLPFYNTFCENHNTNGFKYTFNKLFIPDSLKKLIHQMLKFDPKKRISINEILNDSYFCDSFCVQ